MRRRVAAEDVPLVSLHVTGGVAGVRDEVRVLRSGRALLVRHAGRSRRPRTRSCELGSDERSRIEQLVAAADLDAAAARAARVRPPWVSVADALSCSITIGGRTVASNDSPAGPVGARPVAGADRGVPPAPPLPPPDPDPDPLRQLRSALLELRRRLAA